MRSSHRLYTPVLLWMLFFYYRLCNDANFSYEFRTKKSHAYVWRRNKSDQSEMRWKEEGNAYKSRDMTSLSSSKMAMATACEKLLQASLDYAADKLGIPSGKFWDLASWHIYYICHSTNRVWKKRNLPGNPTLLYLRDHSFYDGMSQVVGTRVITLVEETKGIGSWGSTN